MTEPTTKAGRELLASIYILVSGKDGEQDVRDWSRDRILAIEAEARATVPLDVERLRRYVVNNRDVWTDEPSGICNDCSRSTAGSCWRHQPLVIGMMASPRVIR